jgi:ATP-dependent DNA ligase
MVLDQPRPGVCRRRVHARPSLVDALIVGYYDGDKLYYVGKVRNGFVPQVRREVYRKFKGLEIDTCPFANLPEKKRTMWALTREE